MKKLILSSVIIIAILSSAMVDGQTEVATIDSSDPVNLLLKRFESRLQEADKTLGDRNSRLRLERALYYYQSSKRLYQANWRAKALDHADRGLKLLDLREQGSSDFVQHPSANFTKPLSDSQGI
ncbi:MAG: hypothetical protein ABJV04_01305 [Aliiglaciecola sp.]|uniref:hypothetical protein n=1 Tax=Aliiglaciecola sp. TaxID=1872441 RepID=UPI0032980018